jgi:hypothetical protein
MIICQLGKYTQYINSQGIDTNINKAECMTVPKHQKGSSFNSLITEISILIKQGFW